MSFKRTKHKINTNLCLEQIGRSVVEMFSHRYEELWAKVSEVQVEKWAAVVAAESMMAR